jgi:putative hydrolase of the HAD superfamily
LPTIAFLLALPMNKKAIIIDLDNTIYPVPSIGEKLFAPIFKLIEENGKHAQDMHKIRHDIMRKPFQSVAKTYSFSDDLTKQGITMLKDITYNEPIKTFSDYAFLKQIPADKFLVTTGFMKMQQSKITAMNIENDFRQIYIIDPMVSSKTKKDVFLEIMNDNAYQPSDVLVIGDDAESEIKAAQELGIENVLYDKYNTLPASTATYTISDFSDLIKHPNKH